MANFWFSLSLSMSYSSHIQLSFFPSHICSNVSTESIDFNLLCQFSSFLQHITTHASLDTATLRFQNIWRSQLCCCVSRCYWLIKMHLFLNDLCLLEHFLLWCPNDQAAKTACFHLLVLWTTYPHTITVQDYGWQRFRSICNVQWDINTSGCTEHSIIHLAIQYTLCVCLTVNMSISSVS